MTTRSGLTVNEWNTVKKLFRREMALPVSLDDRRVVRSCIADLRKHFPALSHLVQVVPASTLDWSSTSFAIGEKRVALVDVEQANALTFLLAKSLLLERPIFSYVEFMVRAAEAYYCLGKPGIALLIAKKANSSLRSYARSHGKLPVFPRPVAPDEEVFKALTSSLVLSFVTGHEVGHLLREDGEHHTEVEDWVTDTYAKHESEPGRHNPANHMRFLKPECVQKFNEQCIPVGDIVQAIKLRDRWGYLKSLQIGEAHSDVFGLIAMTEAASRGAVPPALAASSVLGLLEFSEMLMAFRRVLPRLPVIGHSTNVPFEPANLGFRRFMFVQALAAIRKRELPVPKTVVAYWDELPENVLRQLVNASDTGEMDSVSNRSVHIARAALLVSSLGYLPEAPTEEQITKEYGPIAGTGFFLASCLKVSEDWMSIKKHDNWVPTAETETVPMGYASAIHDIAKIVKKSNATALAEELVQKQKNLPPRKIVDIIRHPRTQVFARRLIVPWPHEIMKSI